MTDNERRELHEIRRQEDHERDVFNHSSAERKQEIVDGNRQMMQERYNQDAYDASSFRRYL